MGHGVSESEAVEPNGIETYGYICTWMYMIDTHIYIYICPRMFSCDGCAARKVRMRSISSGLAGGSSLALAWKALSVLDRPAIGDAAALCESLAPKAGLLDWFSFSLGLITGIFLFAFVEAVVTLRWVLVSFCERSTSGSFAEASPRRGGRPLYKIL